MGLMLKLLDIDMYFILYDVPCKLNLVLSDHLWCFQQRGFYSYFFFRIDDYRPLLILEGVSKCKNKEISPELSYA